MTCVPRLKLLLPNDLSDVASGPDADEVARILLAGGVVAVATEYSYALCANARDEGAVNRVLEHKGRSVPSPVVIGHPNQLNGLALTIPPVVFDLQQAFWPGPLTLVMEAVYGLPDGVIGPGRSVAVRVSGWEPLARLCMELDLPLTATSANPTGEAPAFTPQEVACYFPTIPCFGQNKVPNPLPSTVADVRDGFPRVLRPGMVAL